MTIKLPILDASPSDPASRLEVGDSAAVIEQWQAELQASPDNEILWLQLGTAYLSIGHAADAAAALAKAVELDGRLLEARRWYAHSLSALRRYDEAVFQRLQAKRLAPEDAKVARELGVAFYDKKLYDKALKELQRALVLDPNDARSHYAAGLVHEAKQEPAAAIGCYRRAVAQQPDFVDARLTLADALAAVGEMAGAVEQLEQALDHDRSNLQIATNLEILRRGLAELQARRLLGQSEAEVERSALVQEGQLKRRLKEPGRLHYATELASMWLSLDEAGQIRRMLLVLPDPERAANQADEVFQVTVVSQDGRETAANYATAISLTFLREALGCPLTHASVLYAELLKTQQSQVWGDVRVGFDKQQQGLYVELMNP